MKTGYAKRGREGERERERERNEEQERKKKEHEHLYTYIHIYKSMRKAGCQTRAHSHSALMFRLPRGLGFRILHQRNHDFNKLPNT